MYACSIIELTTDADAPSFYQGRGGEFKSNPDSWQLQQGLRHDGARTANVLSNALLYIREIEILYDAAHEAGN